MGSRGREWWCLFLVVTGSLPGCSDSVGPGEDRSGWVTVTAGVAHACAMSQAGDLACWGANDYGGVHPTAGVDATTPVVLNPGFSPMISAGESYTCARLPGGTTWCWGLGQMGQLGWGVPANSVGAVQVEGGPFTMFDAGRTQACGIRSDGVHCWGSSRYGYSNGISVPETERCTDPTFGQVLCILSPERVPDSGGFVEVSAGLRHVCAIDGSGDVYCWGENLAGPLGTDMSDACLVRDPIHGDFTVACLETPSRVELPGRAVSVGASTVHSCALLSDGSVWCWGAAAPFTAYGQLGHGQLDGSATPVQVQTDQDFVTLAVSSTVCALNAAGEAYCWGASRSGAVGVEAAPEVCDIGVTFGCASTPVRVQTDERFTSIAVGSEYTCATSVQGRVLCWGLNDRGQLGDGTTISRWEPRAIDASPAG